MKALILAAGYATRMYPLNQKLHKALLPLGQETLIGHIAGLINTIPDCREIIVVTNRRFVGDFRCWQDQYRGHIPLVLLDDGTADVAESLGAIGDICFSIEQKQIDEDLLIIAGDNYFDFSPEAFVNACRESARDGVCVKKVEDRSQLRQLGVVLLDGNQTIINIEEKPAEPKSDLAMYAIYYYTRDTVHLFARYKEEGNFMDAPGNFLVWLYPRKPIMTYTIPGPCYDVGTVEAYKQLCESLGIVYPNL
ncbi:MAG: sugar phosphate nucleotidyltransferase [Oscillospiraceae bacterium]|nr:sugar phosphate nucleotidyltransferase [Oscillospiraceae bacterium]